MMSIKKIPFGDLENFHVIVEVPQGGAKKYAYDPKLEAVKLSRVLYDGLKFPFNYGFVAQTVNDDGDHLDAFVISTHAITRGTIVACRAVGMLELVDHGHKDHKIIAIPISEHRLDNIKDIVDLAEGDKNKIVEFYEAAAKQWGRTIRLEGFVDKQKAKKELLRTQVLD